MNIKFRTLKKDIKVKPWDLLTRVGKKYVRKATKKDKEINYVATQEAMIGEILPCRVVEWLEFKEREYRIFNK